MGRPGWNNHVRLYGHMDNNIHLLGCVHHLLRIYIGFSTSFIVWPRTMAKRRAII